jgi:hypothetical protein
VTYLSSSISTCSSAASISLPLSLSLPLPSSELLELLPFAFELLSSNAFRSGGGGGGGGRPARSGAGCCNEELVSEGISYQYLIDQDESSRFAVVEH